MNIDPALLGPVSALWGAIVGGGASVVAAIYTQRYQDRFQRVAREVERREARLQRDFDNDSEHLFRSANDLRRSKQRHAVDKPNQARRIVAQYRSHHGSEPKTATSEVSPGFGGRFL